MKDINGLKKAGIEVLSKLQTLEVNKIAKTISEKICVSFPEHNLNKSDLFMAISRVDMYYAKFNDNSVAKYCYKTETIYFKEGLNFADLGTPAIHECLHFIQTVKNKNGRLLKLGLYDLTNIIHSGLALNEAAVQLMASEASSSKITDVKYYGMDILTISPNYYPIQCALIKQMVYFTGTYPLYHSTIYSDDIFKNTFIMKSNEKTYNKIAKNLDLIVEFENQLQKQSLYLSFVEYNNKNYQKIVNYKESIANLKRSIKDITIETQELILTSCAKSELNSIRDMQDITAFKNKLYNFKKILIQTEDYTFFNEFYCQMMEELDIKRELIQKYGVLSCFKDISEDLSLAETDPDTLNLFKTIIEKLKKLLHINQNKTTESEDN